MNRFLHDCVYALRKLRGTPFSTVTAILVLAIAIGTNSGIYTLVDNLSVVDPAGSNVDRVLIIGGKNRDPQFTNFFQIDGIFGDTIEQNDSFTKIAKVMQGWFTITNIEDPTRIQGLRVGEGFMQIIGVKADVGRVLEERDFEPGGIPGVMITHTTWERGWSKSEDAIDSLVPINGKQHRIVGVLPNSFTYERIDIGVVVASAYLPSDFLNNTLPYFYMVGELVDGVNEEQAEAEISGIESQLQGVERYPGYWNYVKLGVKKLNEFENEYLDTQMNMLLVVGMVILIIAAFNVTNLTLVRLNRRGGEYATRAALGASRFDLFRISAFENGVLVATGYVLGIGLGYALIKIVTLNFEGAQWGLLSQLSSNISLNTRVLGYTGLACLAALLFISLFTLFFSRTKSISVFIKQDTRSSTGSAALNWMTNSLLFLKIAFTCCLLIVGGFFFRSLDQLSKFDFGYQIENIQRTTINMPSYRFEDTDGPTALLSMTDSILDAIRAVPGIEDATLSTLQFPHYGNRNPLRLKDSPADALDQDLPAAWRGDVHPSFFELIGLKTIQGETFGNVHNIFEAEKVVVINEAFVEDHFAEENPIDQFISVRKLGTYTPYRVIGVVSNINRWWLPDDPSTPSMYFSISEGQQGIGWGRLYLKTSYWNAALEQNVREAIHGVESESVIFPFSSLQNSINQSQNSFRFIVFIQTLVSGIGLLLSCVGIYSAVNNAVAQRKREMGIRLALGALPSSVRNGILRRSTLLLAPALLLGLVGAYILLDVSTILDDQLPLVDTANWFIYIASTLGLFAVGIAATLQPAIQASRIDPNKALSDL